jgi:hypothetical protein
LASAVNHPCVLIKKAVSELGLVSQDLEIQKRRRKKSGSNYKVGDIEHRLLARALEGCMSSPNGVSAWSIFNDLNDIDNPLLVLASIKLERLGYLDKGIDEDMNHEEFYTFTITADGIDYLLENERLLERSNSKAPTRVSALDYDDDIPF